MSQENKNLVIKLNSDYPSLLKNDLILAVLHAIKLNRQSSSLASLQSIEVLQELLLSLNDNTQVKN